MNNFGNPYENLSNQTYDNTTELEIWQQFSTMSQSKAFLASILLLFSLATVFGNSLVNSIF